ncbi:MAG: phosphotriesterase [Segetibacter sp.]|nr:phosphotriesterase [Segetibacter sp.]
MNGVISRRDFLKAGTAFLLVLQQSESLSVITVNGSIPATAMGTSLVHEHFLVDFIGADKINYSRWNRDEVVKKVMPYLLDVKKYGVKTIFDCTPVFLGRDVVLLSRLAKESGVQIITNTGYYGAVGNKYLPAWAFTETYKQIAKRWVGEFESGIEDTTVKPGFIKISVEGPHLTELHKKIVKAAALTHLQTGLTICSHTGPAMPAFEEIELLQKMKVHPAAFVWTHAQAEQDLTQHVKAAKLGAWISLDGIGWGGFEKYATSIDNLRTAGLLNKVLISHDAGWYKPGEKDGGSFTGYTNIFTALVPLLKNREFTDNDIHQLLVTNPAEAFAIRVRKI